MVQFAWGLKALGRSFSWIKKKQLQKEILNLAIAGIVFFSTMPLQAIIDLEEWEEDADKGWVSWGKDYNNTQHAAQENKISRSTVKNLELKWQFDAAHGVSVFPTTVDEYLYFVDWGEYGDNPELEGSQVYAVDRDNGDLIWKRSIFGLSGLSSHRVSRTTPTIYGDKIIIGDATVTDGIFVTDEVLDPGDRGASLYALNRFTGALLWKTRVDDHFASHITQSPTIHNGVIYAAVSSQESQIPGLRDMGYECCTFQGSMIALDVETGEILWKRKAMPDNGNDPDGYSGIPIWGSSPVVDAEREQVYYGTGQNYNIPEGLRECLDDAWSSWGKNRCYDQYDADSNYVSSIVAVDMHTGAVNWVHKPSRSDNWVWACLVDFIPILFDGVCPEPEGPDGDFGQAPTMVTVDWDGSPRDILLAGQKTGMFWALDPDDGEVIWSRKVSETGKLGGHQWGSATDGKYVYTQTTNLERNLHVLKGGWFGTWTRGSFWTAMDVKTGKVIWQKVVPSYSALGLLERLVETVEFGIDIQAIIFKNAMGPLAVANGVVYAGSMDNYMHALDARNGNLLWRFKAEGAVAGAPSIVDGHLYWGSGYRFGEAASTVYAFGLPD